MVDGDVQGKRIKREVGFYDLFHTNQQDNKLTQNGDGQTYEKYEGDFIISTK